MGPAGEVVCHLVFNTTHRVLDGAARDAYAAIVASGWTGAYAPCRPSETVRGETMSVAREFAVNAGCDAAAVVRFQLVAHLTMFGSGAGRWSVALQFQHILRGGESSGAGSVELFSLPAVGRMDFGADITQQMQDRLAASTFSDVSSWLPAGVQKALSELEP